VIGGSPVREWQNGWAARVRCGAGGVDPLALTPKWITAILAAALAPHKRSSGARNRTGLQLSIRVNREKPMISWTRVALVLLAGGIGLTAGLPVVEGKETAGCLAQGPNEPSSGKSPAPKAANADGPPSDEVKTAAAEILKQALDDKKIAEAEIPEQREFYIKACSEAIEKLGPDADEASLLKSTLKKAAAMKADQGGEAVGLLREAVSQTHKTLTYKPGPEEMRATAVKILREALGKTKDAEGELPAERELYAKACSEAIKMLGSKGYAASLLESALRKAAAIKADQGGEAVRLLRKAIAEAHRVLTFKPLIQARRPKGFPGLTPIGEVQVKQYPAYRMARAGMKQDQPLFSLAAHFRKNKIATTAPVQVNYQDAGSDKPREQSMAFIYGDPKLGKPGSEDTVEVVDSPAMTAVVTSVCGARSTQKVVEARRRLEAWLKANKDRFAADGPMRVMSYNSPFVPVNRRFFEVQIPVRKVEPKAGQEKPAE